MARTDAWTEAPPFRQDYQLTLVDTETVQKAVRPKQFLHIDQAECILCEGCVDICPWKCIHYLSLDAIETSYGVSDPSAEDGAYGFFVVDEEACTRCALCIDRCPTNVITLGKFAGSVSDRAQTAGLEAPWQVDTGQRDFKNGYAYGVRW
jgi:ferredoxin